MKPRELPVYQEPVLPEFTIDTSEGWSVAPEGFVTEDSSLTGMVDSVALPLFDAIHQQRYFIDIFLQEKKAIQWAASASADWIRLSASGGLLTSEFDKKQTRMYVTIDWNKVPKNESLQGRITFSGGGKKMVVNVHGVQTNIPELTEYKGYIENNGYISMYAVNYSRKTNKQSAPWKVLADIGYTGNSLEATTLNKAYVLKDIKAISDSSSFVEYDFYATSSAQPVVTVFSLPTHPLNLNSGMRYAVAIDNTPLQVVDFRTYGRSEEWKQNVLRNNADRKIQMPFLNKGKHILRIYSMDPGVILDRITIDLGSFKKAYSAVPETKNKK